MGLFSKPEVIVLKESSSAKIYLERLEELRNMPGLPSELSDKLDREIMITKAGILGEDQIMFELKNSGMDLIVLHDLYFEDSEGNGAQVDFIVVTPYVNVFIECKNLYGSITINEKGEFIRTIQYGSKWYKEGIYSPVTQNERHMQIYKNVVMNEKGKIIGPIAGKSCDTFNKSLIVLANPKTVINDKDAPEYIKNQIIRADNLISTLKNMVTMKIAKNNVNDMMILASSFLSRNIEGKSEYSQKLNDLKNEINEQINSHFGKKEKTCPKCGAPLALRTIKKGDKAGSLAWGCSKFPKCWYMRDLTPEEEKETKQPEVPKEKNLICPKCGLPLVVRNIKKGDRAGKQAYGCSGYPKCHYMINID